MTRVRSLQILWSILPACVWSLDYAPGWILDDGSRGDVGIAVLCLILAWAVATAISLLRRGAVAAAGEPSALLFTTAAVYLLAGAAFLAALGPGIAGSARGFARAALGALLITPAWLGLTILHPAARTAAVGILRAIGRRRS
ncbi:MAG: hypothetical protein FJY88_12425 [Candidatus Eisenbacteria bacterium]|nr:hypothetical protein [Candidatus Eisenbacteria bacterium]